MKSIMNECDDDEIATKSFFLGPQAENGEWFQKLISELVSSWLVWRKQVFQDGFGISADDLANEQFKKQQQSFRQAAMDLTKRFESEIPKFSPRYIGHMFSEISLPALVGHWVATLHNPNLIASESAPVGVQIEREAIAELAAMLGFTSSATGHFTSCGSVANLEAALRVRDQVTSEDREFIVLIPENKHYSWIKAAHVLGVKKNNLFSVGLDQSGVMSIPSLKKTLAELKRQSRTPAMIVSVLGTTELGNVDPIDQIQDILDEEYQGRVWHHVDAAYGGFFSSLRNSKENILSETVMSALRSLNRVQSATIDPHKLGYVPYACGAFICRDEQHYQTKIFDSPYIQYSSSKDPGLFTLEGSRSASGAAATWLTLKTIGTDSGGYGRIIARTIRIRRELEAKLRLSSSVRLLNNQHTNVLCFTVGREGESLAKSNEWVQKFYDSHSKTGASFFVSKTSLALTTYSQLADTLFREWRPEVDASEVQVIRLALMNPFIQSKEMKLNILDEFCREVLTFN